MEYYSRRNHSKSISTEDLYNRFCAVIDDYLSRDFFKEKLGLSNRSYLNDSFTSVNLKSMTHIGLDIFPLRGWSNDQIEKNKIFDAIEFLYQFISKPIGWTLHSDETNYTYYDYESYETLEGRKQFINDVNFFLNAYQEGYELTQAGEILFKGQESDNFIDLNFESINDTNIDDLISKSIKQWKSRNQNISDKKQAILNLANIFEYLKRDKILQKVLNSKDTSDLFNIANNFALRHYNKLQKVDYDPEIWYDWIIQFYFATCTATLRLINKNKP